MMLTVEDIHIVFGGRIVLDHVSFSLTPHTITCLVGGNGCGKTTLLNVISGFLRAERGSIRLGDTEVSRLAPDRIACLGVARTFQDLRLITKLSVRENVLLALARRHSERLLSTLFSQRVRASFSIDNRRKADVLLGEYFLSDVADQLGSQISYGQQKLLTLACCAAMGASLILLDEPVAGISAEYRQQIAEHIDNIKSLGKTVLLIEHQDDFLERVGDSFLYLEAGRLQHFERLSQLSVSERYAR